MSVDTVGGTYDLHVLIAARLAGDPTFTVYLGVIPKTPPGPYAVLQFGAGTAYPEHLDASPRAMRWTFIVRCAGFSVEEVLNTVDVVRFRLTGWRPEPNNPASGMLNEVRTDAPLLRDDSVAGDIRFSSTLFYRLNTNRLSSTLNPPPFGLVETGHGPPTSISGVYYLDLDNGVLYQFTEGI